VVSVVTQWSVWSWVTELLVFGVVPLVSGQCTVVSVLSVVTQWSVVVSMVVGDRAAGVWGGSTGHPRTERPRHH